MSRVFWEMSFDTLSPKIKHYGESTYELLQYEKTIPLNQFRRNIFFNTLDYYKNDNEKIKLYTKSKNNRYIKEKNRKLHHMFYKNKEMLLSDILIKFSGIEFINVPKCFKIKIKCGKFLWYDGNQKCFVGESDDKYYVCKYNSS